MCNILFLLLCFPVLALAGVNKCVNDGKVVYSESPCLFGAVVYDAKRVSIADSSVRSLSVLRGANGIYSVPGAVNGQPVDFMIDTGASFTSISGVVAYRLGVRSCVAAGSSNTAAGVAAFCRVVVPTLSVGGFNFVNVTINVLPSMSVDALFGNDLLNHFTVHQRGGIMTLSR